MEKKDFRRHALRALIVVAALAGLLTGVLAWLVSSETAFAWALARLETASGGKLRFEGVHGSASGPIAIDQIDYGDETVRVRVTKMRLTWDPWALLADRLAIGSASAETVAVRLLPSETRTPFPESVGLPLRVSIDRASVVTLEIVDGATHLALRDVALGYEGDRSAHRVRALRLASDWGTLEAKGQIGSRDPFPVDASAVWRDAPDRVAELKLSGTLKRVNAAAEGRFAEVRARMSAIVKPFDALWLERLEGHGEGIDLSRLVADTPSSDIAVSLTAASRDARTVAGTLHARNAIAGTLDERRVPVRELGADFSSDFDSAHLESIEIAMHGGGRFSGSGELRAAGATFALDAHAVNLQGVHSRLIATELDGRVDGSLGESAQAVRAQLAQGPLAIRLDAARKDATLVVREAQLSARGGRLEGSARIALDGDMAVTGRARFAGFDPSDWGSYPAAKVNGELNVKGALARRSGELAFKLTESRLRDVRVAGAGTVRANGERIESLDVGLEIGANRIGARGAFGGAGDTLALTLAAPHLAEVDPRIDGRIDVSARAGGTWQAPQVSFTASGVDVRVRDAVRIGSLGASGTFAWAPGAAVNVRAEVADAAVRGLVADRMTLRANGTGAQHVIEVAASGKAEALTARLVGGWHGERGWAGTLAALENRGALPVSLDSAVPLEIAPDHIVVGTASLRVGSGRVSLGETRIASGGFTTSGDFDALPAALLVGLAGYGEFVESTLVLGGSWRLAATPRLNGTLRVERQSGDLAFRTEPRLALGLSTLGIDAGLVDERATARLVAQGKEITIDVRGEALPVGTGAEAGLARESPITLSARLDIPTLAPFAALLRTRASYDGRVRADVSATGTLGKPVWQGRIDASDVRIQSPPLGIDWHDGLLRADISANAVNVTALSIAGGAGRLSGEGRLTQEGDERGGQLNWKAERFVALNRPDRNLTLSGAGTIVPEGRRVTLRGALRADSGHFEFDPRGTPELGEDVVVSGRPTNRESRSGAERRVPVMLALDLDMGQNLTIRGAGLDAKLVGHLNVRSLPTGQVLAEGAIQTQRGVFRAYGQRLEIERGSLTFDGPIENPAVDIAAWRRNQAVEAGVEVKGPLRDPLVRVVSNPPVSESEQLAWLVLGRPAEAGVQSDYAALQVAAAALVGAAGGESLANRFGLDDIGVASDSQGSQAVTLGKRLSDRIYVSYEQSIDAALAVLRLEFALTRRFSARAETGTRSGMDLFYRYSFD